MYRVLSVSGCTQNEFSCYVRGNLGLGVVYLGYEEKECHWVSPSPLFWGLSAGVKPVMSIKRRLGLRAKNQGLRKISKRGRG